MLKKLINIYFLLSLSILSLSFVKVDKTKIKENIINNTIDKIQIKVRKIDDEEQIGSIFIDKLNINKPLYNINSNKNNIEENITILKESVPPTEDNSILIIAAHSGTGPIAFFKDLDKLNINDEIIINYNKNNYKYYVKDIWEEKKNGYIDVNKENKKQLVLTTCSPNNDGYQLIINCVIKES